MISETAANSDSTERALLYDLWKQLKGEESEEVALDSVKLAIIGILRMSHKRLAVESKGEGFSLTREETAKMQATFNVFYLNRLQHIGKMLEL